MTMAVPQKWVCVFSAVIVLLFVGVVATSRPDVAGISALTRNVEAEKEQSSSNSTMAARSQEEADAFNEKAVAADPEEVASMVEMCRHGYFHVVNNDYTHWEMYAIGGSAEPTINSQGNRYNAPANPFAKEVTKRVDTAPGKWKSWNWRSEGDLLANGAYFTPSGAGASASYARASSLGAKSSSMVGAMTANSGVLGCRRGHQC
ncbi:hypothetical protein H0E87_006228 [Populus deltoides]|uniref:Uncharacterized protein n=1 Tax=Populus deltoides TaxID=3696 RepID=A0A8T2Z5H6_POPDE|nr:hypothetical protein H0E87_006228 [Populus deltoides]